jgi:hypothetical protein
LQFEGKSGPEFGKFFGKVVMLFGLSRLETGAVIGEAPEPRGFSLVFIARLWRQAAYKT